jgi:hypothetical protein
VFSCPADECAGIRCSAASAECSPAVAAFRDDSASGPDCPDTEQRAGETADHLGRISDALPRGTHSWSRFWWACLDSGRSRCA